MRDCHPPILTERSLPIALLRTRETLLGPIRQMLSKAGLTEQQWRVLRVVEESDVLDPTEIAERACLLMPSLTRILHTLAAKGLIDRQPHPHDGRKQQVRLTDAGQRVVDANMPHAVRLCEAVKVSFGEERLELLLELLSDLEAVRFDVPPTSQTADAG